MRIIPHNGMIRQPDFSSSGKPDQNSFVTAPQLSANHRVSPVQEEAVRLYAIGLNVFPQPLGKKGGYPWRKLQYTRLHPTHDTYGLKTLFSSRCNLAVMCGHTSDNLFVIDCESKIAFEHSLKQLRTRNIPIWAAETARGGHIYLHSNSGEVENVAPGQLKDIEIKGSQCYVLAPPSVHPSGIIYQWHTREGSQPPVVDTAIIDWFTDTQGQPVTLESKRPRCSAPKKKFQQYTYNPLSRTTQDYLSNGYTLPEGSRNNRLFSAACDMAGNGYTQLEASSQLTPIAQHSGLHSTEIERTIASAFSQPRSPAKSTSENDNSTKNSSLWKYAEAFTIQHKWEGRTATTDQALFIALVQRAQIASNAQGVFRASYRELSTESRLGTATIQRSIKRLTNSQNSIPSLLLKCGQDKTSDACLWAFSDYVIEQGQQALKMDTLKESPPWLSSSVSKFNSGDVVERGALGRVGLLVYRGMVAMVDPMMPAAIAEFVGVTVNQVNYALKKMCDFGLVIRQPEGWVGVPAADDQLEARVSLRAGTRGKGEARRRRYQRERQIHAGKVLWDARVRCEGRGLWEVVAQEHVAQVESRSTVEITMLPVVQCEARARRSILPGKWVSILSMRYWRCPNCGQTVFGNAPPHDVCHYCEDLTTWKEFFPDFVKGLRDDPLVQLGLELGADVLVDIEVHPPPDEEANEDE